MKGFYLLILAVCTSAIVFSQQLPSQIQAKRGVFTERLFLNDRWIDRIATSVPSIYDSNNNVLPTTKAMADLLRLHSLQHDSVTADGEYTHNWNHKGLRIDSINRLRFDAFEIDSTNPDYPKVHNTIRMYPGQSSDSAINLISVLRNAANTWDSISSQISVSPYGTIMSMQNGNGNFFAGPSGNAITLGATGYNGDFPQTSTISISPQDISLSLSSIGGALHIKGLSGGDAATAKPVAYDPSTYSLVRLDKWPVDPTIKDTMYIPVYTGLTNVASASGGITQAIRVGNTVNVSGLFTVTPTSADANTEVEISLPWYSVVSQYVCNGTGFHSDADSQIGAQITGGSGSSNALFKFKSVSTNPVDFSFSFQYFINLQGE